ncbi:MAG: (2Fe-2S)-binding protein [Rhodospirillales bacterium]|nr:(2Fe-2S)-binding protein [Rhodospirillales bacterium]
MTRLTLRVNGTSHEVETDPATPLIFVLRNQLGFTGPKLGCGLETCGACTVLVDGKAELSCARAASEFEGNEITTVEGLISDGKLSAVQQAFLDEGAAQCGYCIPGIIIAVTGLMSKTPQPSESNIAEALEKHLCRCGSHANVIKAIKRLAKDGGLSNG